MKAVAESRFVHLLLAIDLAGTALFAAEGASTALGAKLDLLGLLVLAIVTAVGGGIIRDLLLGDTPPSSVRDWRYLFVALVAGSVVFLLRATTHIENAWLITTLDAAGLSFFAVAGVEKALQFRLHPLLATVAGLVLGMAARPTLGNLIAGIQIALTEPIRINDSVLVEGEFGQVVEVNTTYVVIRLWDLRHMIVPISHFIEKSFQNWTRYSSELIGAVYLEVDYSVPIKQIREHYAVVLQDSPLWDGNTMTVQVTDAAHSCVQIRLLMSAQNPTTTFDLRCYVREEMLAFLQSEYPDSLPKVRSDVTVARAPSSRLHG